jgi:hypothetical protein
VCVSLVSLDHPVCHTNDVVCVPMDRPVCHTNDVVCVPLDCPVCDTNDVVCLPLDRPVFHTNVRRSVHMWLLRAERRPSRDAPRLVRRSGARRARARTFQSINAYTAQARVGITCVIVGLATALWPTSLAGGGSGTGPPSTPASGAAPTPAAHAGGGAVGAGGGGGSAARRRKRGGR